MDHSESELIDYLRAVWRWKWLIAAGPLVAIVVALAAASRTTQAYTATQTWDIGLPTDDQAKRIQRIVHVYTGQFEAQGRAARIESRSSGVVLVTVREATEETARATLQDVMPIIDRVMLELVDIERKRIDGIRQRRDALIALAQETRDLQRSTVKARSDAASTLLYLSTSETLVRLDSQISELDAMLAASTSPELTRGGAVRRDPARSARMLVFVAGVGGLLLFVVLALTIDYVQTAGRQTRRLQAT